MFKTTGFKVTTITYRPTLRRVLSSLEIFATGFGVVVGFGWILLFGSMVYDAGILAGVLG
jgi:hypothetical protein